MKYIKAIIAFLLPIIGKAVTRAIVDEVVKFAYPDDEPKKKSAYREPTEKEMADAGLVDEVAKSEGHFHDVLMVAFDLDGPNASAVHEWLHNQMPAGDKTYYGREGDIHLDAWWVANDERFDGSDCDSAVFVPKGTQNECRELLAKHNYRL